MDVQIVKILLLFIAQFTDICSIKPSYKKGVAFCKIDDVKSCEM